VTCVTARCDAAAIVKVILASPLLLAVISVLMGPARHAGVSSITSGRDSRNLLLSYRVITLISR